MDPDKYGEYRIAIALLLASAGAAFRYDFEVARTLRSEAPHPINRVFLLGFPDRGAKERFFGDPAYLEIRKRLFDPSVNGATIIAENG